MFQKITLFIISIIVNCYSSPKYIYHTDIYKPVDNICNEYIPFTFQIYRDSIKNSQSLLRHLTIQQMNLCKKLQPTNYWICLVVKNRPTQTENQCAF